MLLKDWRKVVSKIVNKPLLSIIIPVYNTEQFFERCMSSVLSQSYKNIEVIVVNDGSLGNIREKIKDYLEDKRILFIDNQTNQGLLRARVQGAGRANGEYIAFVDSDDYVSFDFFRCLVEKALLTNADIVIGQTVWDDHGNKYIYNYHQSCFEFECLEEKEIKEAYFGQEAQCYSWHTIWNKVYKKELWDSCEKDFMLVKEHIVMTEDIYFSSILFCSAKKVAKVYNDAYFYCNNEQASTNSTGITFDKFKKNINDISFVFDEVEKYLKREKVGNKIRNHFANARKHYARMWEGLAVATFKKNELSNAIKLIDKFSDNRDNKYVNDYFFESVRTPWNGEIEYIKEQIAKEDITYISFDIFDTLISRPFYEPSDLFEIMNPIFSEKINNNVAFCKLRSEGESLARNYYGEKYNHEDISIDEIYRYIAKKYPLSKEVWKDMKKLEKQLEIEFSGIRKTGKELYDLAINCGKRVILVTDMYLDCNTIKTILKKNGIEGYEKIYISSEERKLKYNGALFKTVLSDLHLSANSLLHIGDTWTADIEGSKKAGIKNIFLPKAKDVFENKIQNKQTNRCADIGKTICEEYMDYEKVKKNIGFRCMQALIANKYFDNPYRAFHQQSDFNIDPCFIGYYILGMHMMGVVKWISNVVLDKGRKKIIFLARDGYLPARIFDIYAHYYALDIEIEYMQASRRALMPMILKDKINFYQLPIEYKGHSPGTMLEVFRFAIEEEVQRNWEEVLKQNGFAPDKKFETKKELYKFVDFFMENIYSLNEHEKSKALVKEYYNTIQKTDIIFDMGYSGRIQSALCETLDFPVDALFVHEDYDTSIQMRSFSGFDIEAFYNYRPIVTGLIREYIFSDTGEGCIAFNQDKNGVVPVFEQEQTAFSNRYIVSCLQKGACDFVKDFLNTFGMYQNVVDYSEQEVSMPFEGFLRHPNKVDLHIFAESYFEDRVYGARSRINVEKFINQQIDDMDQKKVNGNTSRRNDILQQSMMEIMNSSPKWKRAIMWLMINPSKFVEKIKGNIEFLMRKR